jgi:dTDP-glucose 4,6-dehydratase
VIAIVTGGAGFIGSELVKRLLFGELNHVYIFDSLTYASQPENLPLENTRVTLMRVDIANKNEMKDAWSEIRSAFEDDEIIVYNLAAESHVDRSIQSGELFFRTNVLGTQLLLEHASRYGVKRFLHVSTDEVYGSLEVDEAYEDFPLKPSSAYSASKAASDLAVIAHHITHGLDTVITRCVNNFGLNQFPEKLLPRIINRCLRGESLPIYGDGKNVREWIHVSDHANALTEIMMKGIKGSIYNIGTGDRLSNLEIANAVIDLSNSNSSVEFVEDRKGHDSRYAVNSAKLRTELKWAPQKNLLSELDAYICHIKSRMQDPRAIELQRQAEIFYGK